MELGVVLASTFKVGVDFIDIWRILFVVCDLKDKKQMEVKHNQLVPKKVYLCREELQQCEMLLSCVLYYKSN